VRDKVTGEIEARPYTFRTQVLVSRKAVLNMAVGAFNDGIVGSPDHFDEVVIGAAYSGTIAFNQE